MRGNLRARRDALARRGSIPASAGEPAPLDVVEPLVGVYPRECGGTHRRNLQALLDTGLSPRVRGNPLPVGHRGSGGGSIPASAGEPPRSDRGCAARWVYPRECGGTVYALTQMHGTTGLSPRVRGNHTRNNKTGGRVRSIPASAGEPPAASSAPPGCRVYPRECGGTSKYAPRSRDCAGLSPRVRGNPVRTPWSRVSARSIPASAGEPRTAIRGGSRTRVYPRECGGTRRDRTTG